MFCKFCLEALSEDSFYSSNKTKCKDCIRSAVTKNRMANIEHYRAYDRARASLPKRKIRSIEIVNRWKAQFPNRRKAQNMLNNALRDKRIEKQPCFVCGGKSEAHHPDYDRPLDVVWLCSAHHKQTHAMAQQLLKAA